MAREQPTGSDTVSGSQGVQILITVGRQTDQVFKVIVSKVKVICLPVC